MMFPALAQALQAQQAGIAPKQPSIGPTTQTPMSASITPQAKVGNSFGAVASPGITGGITSQLFKGGNTYGASPMAGVSAEVSQPYGGLRRAMMGRYDRPDRMQWRRGR